MKYLIYVCLLVVMLMGLVPTPVYATTITQIATGEGYYIFGTYVGGAADYTNINTDDDTAYIQLTYNKAHTWEFADTTPSATINSVTFYFKAKNPSGSVGILPMVRIGGIDDSHSQSITTLWVLYSYTWATNPSTGLAWTKSDVDSAQFGFQATTVSNNWVTYAYVVVDYIATVPSTTTDIASNISYTGGVHSVTLNGDVTGLNGGTLDLRGFVWGATSNSTNPDNIVPPSTYTANSTEGASAIGIYSYIKTGLIKGTTYYYRSYAHNNLGYAYGDEVAFTMLNDPSITTSSVSQITSATARLNALVSNDGGQSCEVRFLRGTVTNVYTSNTTAVDGYETGDLPYVDISGLAIGTTYYIRAEITNDVSTQLGAEITFTTSTGVSEPTNLVVIPEANSVSLSWAKGVGSSRTLIRYKAGSYPTSTTDGALVYFDVQSSTTKTGLAAGTTYYIMAWGETSGFYSTSNATVMVTTLASTGEGVDIVDNPSTSDMWFQSPDYTNMQNTPFYSIVNFAADQWEIPKSTFWYMLAMMVSVSIGIIFYSSFGNNNLLLSIVVVAGTIIVMAVLKLVPLWNIVPFVVIALAGIFVGERR
ncbi:MAG: hypothetical protein WC516_08095 [Patescibacteria group bacterium]